MYLKLDQHGPVDGVPSKGARARGRAPRSPGTVVGPGQRNFPKYARPDLKRSRPVLQTLPPPGAVPK